MRLISGEVLPRQDVDDGVVFPLLNCRSTVPSRIQGSSFAGVGPFSNGKTA